MQAGLLDVEIAEDFFVFDGRVCFGEGTAAGFIGDRSDVRGEFFVVRQGEDVDFEDASPFGAPFAIDDSLREEFLYRVLGSQIREELQAECFVLGGVFCGEDDNLAGQAVAGGIEGRDPFAGFGAWAGGMLGVFFVAECLSC